MPELVTARLFELPSYHQKRALLALSIFSFAPARSFAPRTSTLFNSIRRLILHVHYGRPVARPPRELHPWEGPLPDAGTVVAQTPIDIVRERIVPSGVIERAEENTTVSAEFCIIGSGVGGSMAAAILAEAGRDVVVLEEGGYYTPADFGDDENRALSTLYADAGLRTTDSMNVSILQGRCAGGGSTVNWMVMLRTPEYVLEEWRRQHGFDFTDAEMNAAFERFERDSNVGVVAEHAHSRANWLLLDGCRRLGWRAQGASVNARECMRVGRCGMGCPYGAKQGATLTYLPRALRAGARLYCNEPVQSIRSGVVRARNLTVRCKTIILAAGAIGTPTILQRSGLGNKEVGRHLRLHPTTAVVGIYDEPIYAASGIPLTTYCNEFSDLRDGYGHWIETPPLSAGLAAIALPAYGTTHRSYMQRFSQLGPLIVLVRDGQPSGPSVGWVRAGREHVTIRYRLGSADRAALNHGIASAKRIHQVMGARKLLTLHATERERGDPALFTAHVNGTCRLGGSERTSACAPDGALRGHDGIYVLDGSLLPTAPGVNPHETIAAVTMILAERLK